MNFFGDFLNFRKFITPMTIKIVYVIGSIAIFIGFIWSVFQISNWFGGGWAFLIFILGLPISLFLWRLIAESIMVRFRQYEVLVEISGKITKKIQSAPSPTSSVASKSHAPATSSPSKNTAPPSPLCRCAEPVRKPGGYCGNCNKMM